MRIDLESRGTTLRAAVCNWPVVFGVFMILGACGDPFTAAITNRRAFNPPVIYQEWWDATRGCSNLQGDFIRIDWFLADGITGDAFVARARWSPPHDIVIVSSYEADEAVVRHEMLHDLLGGDPAHQRRQWDDCGLRAS